jgi:hypothetical protein
VQGILVERVAYAIAPLNAGYEVEVGFVEVNHAELVDVWVVWLFEEHHVEYNFLAIKGVPVGGAGVV